MVSFQHHSQCHLSSREQLWSGWPLTLVVVLAAGLRLIRLAGQSFWLDEALTIANIRQIVRPSLAISGTTPPLYKSFIWAWLQIFPNNEFSVRLPSLFFGVLSVVLIYLIGRRLFSHRTGLAASILLAVSPFHIQYSQEARTYSLTVFLALLSYHGLLRIMERETPWRYLAYGVSAALFLLSHNYAVFFFLAQILFVFIRGRRHGIRIVHWLIGLGVVGLAILPWFKILYLMVDMLRQARYWIEQPVLSDFVQLYRLISFDSGYAMKINLLLVAAGGLWWWRERNVRQQAQKQGGGSAADSAAGDRKPVNGTLRSAAPVLLVTWIAIPVILMIVVSYTVMPIYQHRYLLAVLPAVLLLIAWGGTGHGRRVLSLALVGLLVCLASPGLLKYYTEPNRQPWREAASIVAGLAHSGDVLFITAPMVNAPFRYYYDGPDLPIYVLSRHVEIADSVEQSVVSHSRGKERVWAVISHNRSGFVESLLEKYFGEEGLLEHWSMKGIDIYCYHTGRPRQQ